MLNYYINKEIKQLIMLWGQNNSSNVIFSQRCQSKKKKKKKNQVR